MASRSRTQLFIGVRSDVDGFLSPSLSDREAVVRVVRIEAGQLLGGVALYPFEIACNRATARLTCVFALRGLRSCATFAGVRDRPRMRPDQPLLSVTVR